MSTPDTETHRIPALGEPGEQCGHCGAVLAPDQRYCVNCGLRRTDPRVAYRELLPASGGPEGGLAPAAPPAPAAPAPAAAETRTVSPLGAAVAIGLLLLATMLGAVLGRGTDSDQPPVIVGAPAAAGEATTAGAPGATAGGTPAAEAAAAAAAGAAAGAASGSESKAGEASSASGSSDAGSGSSGAAPAKSAPTPSTQDFVKKSKKLPDKVGTGGKPPPKDKAAPGGGSEGTTIG